MGIRIKTKFVSMFVAIAIFVCVLVLSGLTTGCAQLSAGDDDSSPVEAGVQPGNPVTGGSESSGNKPDPEGSAGGPVTSLYVKSLVLINAETGTAIRDLKDGDVIDLGKDGKSLSIRALTDGGAESAAFDFDGARKYIDNVSPYSLAEDSSGNSVSTQLALGSHILAVTPYTADYAQGSYGITAQISFSVIDSSRTTAPTPTPAPTTGGPLETFRSEVVRVAKAEASLGLCGATARTRYLADSGSAWCSEFARWVFMQAGVMSDSASSLMNLTGWSRFRTFFTNKGKFLSRSEITREDSTSELMTGNYLLLDTDGDGVPNHSALIVGVSSDLASLYTVEGNVSNCTKSLTRKFWSGASLDSKIMGIGMIWE